MSLLSPNNPFDIVNSALKYSQEFTYKGVELRATSITDNHGHDHAVHSHIDVPGGAVEITGRKPYVIEAEVVFAGNNWEERYANAIWIHDTQADEVGELIVPKGNSALIFDAKWTDAVSTWSSPKYGQIIRCTFKEHSYAEGHEIVELTQTSSTLETSIPEEYEETLSPFVDDYVAAIDKTENEAMLALTILAAEIVAIQSEVLAIDTSDSFDIYLSLQSALAIAIRLFPNQDNKQLSSIRS